MRNPHLLTITAIICSINSCDRPECKNTNPIFEKYPPIAKEYKIELANQLNQIPQDKLSFWINGRDTVDHKLLIRIYVQGNGLCAKMMMDFSQGKNHRGFTAQGYNGAQMIGLKYRIDTTNGNCNFIFEDVDHIID